MTINMLECLNTAERIILEKTPRGYMYTDASLKMVYETIVSYACNKIIKDSITEAFKRHEEVEITGLNKCGRYDGYYDLVVEIILRNLKDQYSDEEICQYFLGFSHEKCNDKIWKEVQGWSDSQLIKMLTDQKDIITLGCTTIKKENIISVEKQEQTTGGCYLQIGLSSGQIIHSGLLDEGQVFLFYKSIFG